MGQICSSAFTGNCVIFCFACTNETVEVFVSFTDLYSVTFHVVQIILPVHLTHLVCAHKWRDETTKTYCRPIIVLQTFHE